MHFIRRIKRIASGHSKIVENYLFMTILHGANMLIGLFMYPYLIRTLGQSAYGTYVFVNSCIAFFILFICFGFTFPALKQISLHPDDHKIKNKIVSEVFTAKVYLSLFSAVIFSVLLFSIPFFRENRLLYLVVFSLIINEILFPVWFFQGIQKMKLVTIIQLSTRLLTIPLIFIFIKSADDLLLYAVIISSSVILGSLISAIYLRVKEQIYLRLLPLHSLKQLFKDALPFFWMSAMSTAKREAITLVIGTFFGMKDVALYDLANKLITIPRLITRNINDAIFPKVIKEINPEKIKKIIRYETWIGSAIVFLIVVFGYWAVLLLGGKGMVASYPLAIILSFTIYTWLVVGCYINYIFVPQNKYYFVAKNQMVALGSFIVLCGVALLVYKNMLVIVSAFTLSGIIEIFYCRYLTKKYQLL